MPIDDDAAAVDDAAFGDDAASGGDAALGDSVRLDAAHDDREPRADVGDASPPAPDASAGVDSATCVPLSCAAQGRACGTWADGCGSQVACGVCPDDHSCNAQGQCVCQPATCAGLGVECGAASDGCGGTLACGGCDGTDTCQGGSCVPAPLDCSPIAAVAAYELCQSTATLCAGVFTNGAGCNAFCAAAGLQCVARYGGEPGCQKEPAYAMGCDDVNGHLSDWCECGPGSGTPPPDPTCASDPTQPPRQLEKHYTVATYGNRSAWALTCRDYAYTAQYEEHEACDSLYQAGSGRGSASFVFSVPRGRYDVFLVGRHTPNRNSQGALVRVRFDGQEQTARVMQNDDAGLVADLVGRYCLGGSVEVMLDSTVSAASDSVQKVRLVPAS
jgi:hypothetical protein